MNVSVDGVDGSVVHSVPADRVHSTGKAVLVSVFKDADGLWIRFPTMAPYKPFRVSKDQLRKL